MGLLKVGIAVAIYIVCRILRFIYESFFRDWCFSSEQDNGFNICLCILLAAWIVREGLW